MKKILNYVILCLTVLFLVGAVNADPEVTLNEAKLDGSVLDTVTPVITDRGLNTIELNFSTNETIDDVTFTAKLVGTSANYTNSTGLLNYLNGTTNLVTVNLFFPLGFSMGTYTLMVESDNPAHGTLFQESYPVEINVPQCADTLDNDADGLTDANDPGCLNADNSYNGTVDDESRSQPVAPVESKLAIKDLEVKVDGKRDSSVSNGEKISKEAEPGSRVIFEIELENLYNDDDEDLDIEDITVEVRILDIDDGDDLEEESDEFDIDPEDEETVDLEFDIPLIVDEDTYDVEILVEGEDENNTKFEFEWLVFLEVEKENHEIRVSKTTFNPSVVRCEDTVVLTVELANTGGDDEDEVVFEVVAPDFDFSFRQDEIELDEGDDDDSSIRKTLNIPVPSRLGIGSYPVTIKTYYDTTRLSDTEVVNVDIDKCITSDIDDERFPDVDGDDEDTRDGDDDVVVDIIDDDSGEQEDDSSEVVSLRESTGYTAFLVIALIILIIVLIVFFVAAGKK